jgi:hypothetical protein
MFKTGLFIILVATLLLALPVLSGRATAMPNSLEPTAIAIWLSHIIQYWIDLVKELIIQVKL